jgi:hypothetical protein
VAATLHTFPKRAQSEKRKARQWGSSNVKEKDGWPWARDIEKPTASADPKAGTEKS